MKLKRLPIVKSSLFIFCFIILIFFSCSKKDHSTPQPTESDFESVTIGTQVWMKKNLDVDHYRNGDSIPEVKDFNIWDKLTTGGWHYYNNDTANGRIYGKLYNWYTVNDPRGLAPKGWHIPSDSEWTVLTDYLGELSVAGGKMKEAGTSHWTTPNTGATNSSGFSALAAGTSTGLIFWQIGYNTYWWSSSSFNAGSETDALFRAVYNDAQNVNRSGTVLYNGFSVRCIKD